MGALCQRYASKYPGRINHFEKFFSSRMRVKYLLCFEITTMHSKHTKNGAQQQQQEQKSKSKSNQKVEKQTSKRKKRKTFIKLFGQVVLSTRYVVLSI